MADQGRTPTTPQVTHPSRDAGGPGTVRWPTTLPALPRAELPEGGGAIRGIGEKLTANPSTGTASLSIPLAISPGRAGSTPTLSLDYESGGGNGPFGIGWQVTLPAITRKTDRGLPTYRDDIEADVFLLAGAEDLVPAVKDDGADDALERDGFAVRRYRPRTEGLFARIERWTRADGSAHWRVTTRDGVLSVYGETAQARIADPSAAHRVFSWLLERVVDPRGHVISYLYKAEDLEGVERSPYEAHRLDTTARVTNRYPKRVRYGNLAPGDPGAYDPETGSPADAGRWLFEIVFDYGEHWQEGDAAPAAHERRGWPARTDPFSSYRAGFEIRTWRLCRRILMFHHIEELGAGPTLVRSTELDYDERAHLTRLQAVQHVGWRREGAGYLRRALPPLEVSYTEAVPDTTFRFVEATSFEGMRAGIAGRGLDFVDLDGEGVSGVLWEQAGGSWYRRGEPRVDASGRAHPGFGPFQRVDPVPAGVGLAGAALTDVDGDGRLSLASFRPPLSGTFRRTEGGWAPFRAFRALPHIDLADPDLRFVDLDGDGLSDVMILRDDGIVWYRSRGQEGFKAAPAVPHEGDASRAPRVLFTDPTGVVALVDLTGDGLQDLVRVRNGSVCYWPNLGHGRFGPRVTMAGAPVFDAPDAFDPRRVRFGDLDGSGPADLLYLHPQGVRWYGNQSGNAWGPEERADGFPTDTEGRAVQIVDLFGNGTSCVVCSSWLPGDAARPLAYLELYAQKPHLLAQVRNNLGAVTTVTYAASTRFYLEDRAAGRPWATRLPFPVQVVERVEVRDEIGKVTLVTRYAYHHGHYDGLEREFRGFGMVEQWDAESFGEPGSRAAFAAPPIRTRTWFHTGAWIDGERLSARYRAEYWAGDPLAWELPDTPPPDAAWSAEEARESVRALKGRTLRTEIYADDGSERAASPYLVTEHAWSVRRIQPRGPREHAVFFAHAREAVTYHYERDPADPRVQHALTLEVDAFGDVLKEAAIGYGRRQPDPALALQVDRDRQTTTLITYTESRFTNAIDDPALFPDAYRAPSPCEARTFELTGYTPTGPAGRFQGADFVQAAGDALAHAFDTEIPYEGSPTGGRQRRPIEQIRTLYRKDDLTALLPLGQVEPLALPGESYGLAFTPGLLAGIFQRNGQALLPDPADVLGGRAADQGGYLPTQRFKADGLFPDSDPDDHWWIPSGRVFFSPESEDTAAQELAHARRHFFLPHRFRDPFHAESSVTYDAHDLLLIETRDALGNRVTVGERRPDGAIDPSRPGNDYRVLRPSRVMDPNRNRAQVAFDALGMVVGTAVMGKPEEELGDSLDGFIADLSEDVLLEHLSNPLADPGAILGRATTRLVHDLFAYRRTMDQPEPRPAVVYTLARETHDADLEPGDELRIQHGFTYSDGFGREVQKKLQAEPGPLVEGGPAVGPRWVGSGWTTFNNKGKPVRRYEPFFSATHRFESGVEVGVSPILLYDPVERVVAVLHPDHTYEKVVFDPWRQATWDANDTVLDDPRRDADIRGYTAAYFASLPASPPAPPWETWYAQRAGAEVDEDERGAARRAAAHAGTPTIAHLDALGRPFMTVAHNRVACPGHPLDGTESRFHTRVELDIEGNQRAVRDAVEQAGDARGRVVMRYAYDMLGNRVHQLSMEAGARWTLSDVTGKPIRAWDSRGHGFRTEYDPLRRPLRSFVRGADPSDPDREILTERLVYGEQHPEAEPRNLRARLCLHLDQAGLFAAEAHDFKGNPLRATRRLTSGTRYRQAVDWRAVDADRVALPADAEEALDLEALEAALAPWLEADTYTSSTTYDALNRPVTQTTPHTPAMRPSVIRRGYNEANLLERVEANLRGAAAGGQPVWTPFVRNIDYDARGRRRRIDHDNGASTLYDYDPLTFRLVRLRTRRDRVAFPDDCPRPPPAGWPGCDVQSLRYTYDPVGNITHIRDGAQQRIFFANRLVEPSADYTYDATYRLVRATGREHLGQGGAPVPHSHDDALRSRLPHPGDGNAMGTYVERFVYDAVGNLLEMQHRGSNPVKPGWTRRYAYLEASLIEDGAGGDPSRTSNRLSYTTVGNDGPTVERYAYAHDAHGNMIRMPHLGGAAPAPNMRWDHRDQLCEADLGGGGTAYYVYDAAGQRVRKVWEKSAGLVEERVYLGGFEIFRRRQGAARLERETLHVMDDQQRVALVETRTEDTAGEDRTPERLVRYQLGNHLGSASLELDEQGQVISYEEYTPYGSTSYQAVRSRTEAAKRYRYTGKERDEESGLGYHGARYYAPWLGAWTSADPAGLVEGTNLYQFCRGSPVGRMDGRGTASMGPPTGASVAVNDEQETEAQRSEREAAQRERMAAYREEDLAKIEDTERQAARTVERAREAVQRGEELAKAAREAIRTHDAAQVKANPSLRPNPSLPPEVQAKMVRAELENRIAAGKAAEAQRAKLVSELKAIQDRTVEAAKHLSEAEAAHKSAQSAVEMATEAGEKGSLRNAALTAQRASETLSKINTGLQALGLLIVAAKAIHETWTAPEGERATVGFRNIGSILGGTVMGSASFAAVGALATAGLVTGPVGWSAAGLFVLINGGLGAYAVGTEAERLGRALDESHAIDRAIDWASPIYDELRAKLAR